MSSCIPVTNSLSKKNNTNQNPTIREEAEMRTLPYSSLCIKRSTNLQKQDQKEKQNSYQHFGVVRLPHKCFLVFPLSLSLYIYIHILLPSNLFGVVLNSLLISCVRTSAPNLSDQC
mmetsp:Transcript_22893/g.25858  ORF Transcript_22893/g.25858 Transcript_22893/m.25858 type:complete len:116 (-) Transcript_22893:1227-1574(-)